MARKRMIDPSIWESQDFSELPDNLTKLVFIGLFSLADDEGRGIANPCLIKSKLFPYSESLRVTDIKKSLNDIAAKMSVIFYKTHDGKEYYALTNWCKWQSVPKPSPSSIPEYNEDFEVLYIVPNSSDNSSVTLPNRFGNGSVTVQPKRKERKGKEKEKKGKESGTPSPSLTNTVEIDFEPIISKWNTLKDKGISQISGIEPNSRRHKQTLALIKKYGVNSILENIDNVQNSDFLCGKNERGWMITFDWFTNTDNFLKVFENNYKNSPNKKNPNGFNNFSERKYDDEEMMEYILKSMTEDEEA